MLIKKQIKEDYKSNLIKIQQRVEKNKRKYDKRYKQNQINEICYMTKMQEIQEWKSKAQKEIQTKKKHHLNICGYFKDFMKMKDKSPDFEKIDYPDSEKFSNSGILERHVRTGSQHLSYARRNHVLEGYKSSSNQKDRNKSVSNLNESHEDRLSQRVKTIDIVSSHNQSFSSKGPIMPLSGIKDPLRIDSEAQIGRKSENLYNYQTKSLEEDAKFDEGKQIKQSIEKKMIDSQEVIHQKPKCLKNLGENNPDENDNLGIKCTKDCTNEANLDAELVTVEKDQQESLKIGQKDSEEEKLQKWIEPNTSENEKSLGGFPSIGESASNIQKSRAMLDEEILESILNGNDNEKDPLSDDKIFESDTKQQINSETKDLDTSSVYSEPQQKEVLIASSRSNVPVTESGDDFPHLLKENNFFPSEDQNQKQNPDLEIDVEADNALLATDSVIEEPPSKIHLSNQAPQEEVNKCQNINPPRNFNPEEGPPCEIATVNTQENQN